MSINNSVQLIGRLGKDVELRTFESGSQLATFSMATNDIYYNNSGEKVEDTQWHNVAAWGKVAQNAEKLLTKGTEVAVGGKLINRSYEKDGEKRYVTEVHISEFKILGAKASNETAE